MAMTKNPRGCRGRKKMGRKPTKFVIVGCPKCREKYPAKLSCAMCQPVYYQGKVYDDPTPLQIHCMCEKIRSGWSAGETEMRIQGWLGGGQHVVRRRKG